MKRELNITIDVSFDVDGSEVIDPAHIAQDAAYAARDVVLTRLDGRKGAHVHTPQALVTTDDVVDR